MLVDDVLVTYAETTASTLAGTLGMLALHPQIQDEIVEQIVSVTGDDRDPVCLPSHSPLSHTDTAKYQTFEELGKLSKVAAAFFEGSRMFRLYSLIITFWS
jgi:cytochrome P450